MFRSIYFVLQLRVACYLQTATLIFAVLAQDGLLKQFLASLSNVHKDALTHAESTVLLNRII